jgi:hypothetical protein
MIIHSLQHTIHCIDIPILLSANIAGEPGTSGNVQVHDLQVNFCIHLVMQRIFFFMII